MDELNLLRNRFTELAERSYSRGIYTFSDFLTIAEQSELNKLRLSSEFSFFGGYEEAERRIAVFGSTDELGYDAQPPVTFIKIEPVQQKFADALSHRDFLGSLMGLGIKRELLGDIIIKENVAYLVCLDSISEYIIAQLDKVRHTNVECTVVNELPDEALPELTYEEHIVASERLDVIVSAVYNLSRNESQKRIESETVYCNSILTTNPSFTPAGRSIISVRGSGRFVYDGVLRNTKKGRNVIAVKKY